MLLHITNDYSGSTVYKNLIGQLDQLEYPQIVYNPIKEAGRIDKNRIELKTPGARIIYSHILNKTTDRVFYPIKIRKIVDDIEHKVDLTKIQLIHAHTWYSDGGAAYVLSKKYNIPYVVAIRSTDLDVFQKRLIYLRPFGRKILYHAKRIILIAASFKTRIMEQSSLQVIKRELDDKIIIIPNGVDPFWINNAVSQRKYCIDNTFQLLYVGTFIKRKKLADLQEAIKIFSKERNNKVHLHIVGGGGCETEKILDNVKEYPNLFTYHGKVYDKNKLLKIFRSCNVFAMPSYHETFGLVYVEALLQGLPILYRKNEGIDGFYTEKIGEAVAIGDAEEIKNKLELLYENYQDYEINIPLVAKTHDWKLIAADYRELYK